MSKISWQVKSNHELVIDDHNKEAIFNNKKIEYIDNYGIHNIDLINKIYKRKDTNLEMTVDFNINTFVIIFDDKRLEYDIKTSLNIGDNIVKLTYSLGDEIKEIIVMKEGLDEN